MKRFLLFLFLFGVFPATLVAQSGEAYFDLNTLEKVKPSIVAWTWDDGVYNSKEEPHTVYLLMNIGAISINGVKPPISKNYKELVKSWLADRPGATAFVMTTIPGVSERLGWIVKPVWVIDKEEILNVFLVRMGGCPAKSMTLSANRENSLTIEQYRGVHKKLWEAELLARNEKLGIWANPEAK